MKKERWRLYAKKADFAAISKAYGINQVTARIMRNRGVETKEEIESYLKGDLDYLSDPALMKDADKAASLLEAAIANNELIAISSDFDNDGIFSGLLFKRSYYRTWRPRSNLYAKSSNGRLWCKQSYR
mgnify:FL=1